MNRKDVLLPPPGSYRTRTPFPVTSTGDLVLVSGGPSVEQWAIRTALTDPGDLLTAPDFGGGAESSLGLPVTAQGGVRARIRRALLGDDRIRDSAVSSEIDDDGRVVLNLQIETVDGVQPPVVLGIG